MNADFFAKHKYLPLSERFLNSNVLEDPKESIERGWVESVLSEHLPNSPGIGRNLKVAANEEIEVDCSEDSQHETQLYKVPVAFKTHEYQAQQKYLKLKYLEWEKEELKHNKEELAALYSVQDFMDTFVDDAIERLDKLGKYALLMRQMLNLSLQEVEKLHRLNLEKTFFRLS